MKAFKTFLDCPDKPLDIPNEWPWQVQDCLEQDTSLMQSQGFTVLSDSQYEEYLETHKAAYDAWYLLQPKYLPPVTNQQLRQALILKAFQENHPEHHPDAIKTFILGLPDPTKSLALNFWEYSNEMLRNNTLLNQLSPMIGLSQTDLDNLFIAAKGL